MSVIEWVISILVVIGGIFSIIAALGILRLPDVYSRLHATGKSSVTASLLILIATFIYFQYEHGLFLGKILLGIILIVITVPIAVFIIARSSYRLNSPLSDKTIRLKTPMSSVAVRISSMLFL